MTRPSKTPTAIMVKELFNEFKQNLRTEYTNAIDNGNGTWALEICDPFYLRKCSIILINDVKYEVILVEPRLIIVKGDPITITQGVITLPEVFFFNGTPLRVGAELNTIECADDKLPLIYLYEVISDNHNNKRTARISRTSSIRLFFLDQANFEDWDMDETYSDAVTPMSNLLDMFVCFLDENAKLGTLDSWQVFYHSKFNINRTVNGVKKALFADDLSGAELQVTLPIKKNIWECKDCC